MQHYTRLQSDRYAVLLGVLLGCIDPSGPPVPTSVAIVTGVPTQSTPGESFDTIRVKFTSEHGEAVSGWRVIWNAPGGLTGNGDTSNLPSNLTVVSNPGGS